MSVVITQFCLYCCYCTYLRNGLNLTCDYYEDCGNYNNLCYDDSEVSDYSQLLDCTEVDVVNADALNYYEDGDGESGGYSSYRSSSSSSSNGYYDNGQQSYYNNYNNEGGYYQQEQAYQNGYDNDNDGKRKRSRGRGRSLEDNGRAYVKGYCDGLIKLGLFSDDTCSNYIGGVDAVYETTGISDIEDEMNDDIFSNDCYSCTKKVTTSCPCAHYSVAISLLALNSW